jgi:Fe-coproporphyrin III synthase
MVKKVVKQLLGRRLTSRIAGTRLTRVVRTGIQTLHDYPQYLRGGIAGPLRNLDIEITFNCNARCRMCPAYGEHMDQSSRSVACGRKELTTDAIGNVLRQCAQMGTERVEFTGGEPLLRPDLPELVGIGNSLGMRVSVLTNGVSLTENVARELTAAGLDTLAISLDGPEEVHNFIRRVPNMFARMDRNVSTLRAEQARQKRTTPLLSVGCTVSTLNQGCLHELVPIAARWKASLYLYPVFFVLDPKDQRSATASDAKPEDWLLPARIRDIDPDLLARELALVRRLSWQSRVPLNMEKMDASVHMLRQRYYSPSYSVNNKCLYPWYNARMNPYGDIYPCSLQTIVGNVMEEPLHEIWNSERYLDFRRSLRKQGLFAQCARCCTLSRDDWVARLLPRFPWLV